jgi:hypothetical protein
VRVSLYAGLRYEAALTHQLPVANTALPHRAVVPRDLAMWQPRLGLSWSPGADGRTVVRLGSGIFYARTPSRLVHRVFNSNGNPDVGITLDQVAPRIDAVPRIGATPHL